jgi:hypothetical protein
MARGKMKSLHGLYKALGKDRFLELAQHYSNHVRDTVEGTLNEMERRWYDADHTLTEAEKMVSDYNSGTLLAPATEAHPKLIGYSLNGTFALQSVQEVAEFICREGKRSDLTIRTESGEFFLSTFGTFLDRIADMDYRRKLLDVLVPMQMGEEASALDIKM